MKNFNQLFKSINTAHDKYRAKLHEMEQVLTAFSDIEEISVFYQESDGFVVADDERNNAPLDACLKVIKEKGFLSNEDYLDLTI